MLPAANRLRHAADFTDTTRRGARASRGSVTAVVALPSTSADSAESARPPRVGLVVGKRVGGSVARHRVARRLRSAVRTVLADLPPGCTVVLRASPGAATEQALPQHTRDAVVAAAGKAAARATR